MNKNDVPQDRAKAFQGRSKALYALEEKFKRPEVKPADVAASAAPGTEPEAPPPATASGSRRRLQTYIKVVPLRAAHPSMRFFGMSTTAPRLC